MSEPVAIVGMSVLLPGADSLEDYWRNLVAGTDSITDVPENRWQSHYYDPDRAGDPSRLYCRRGGFVDEFAYFDPLPFGIMPGSVLETEQDQLLALRVAAAAIEDAGGTDRLPDRDRVGVVLGRLAIAGMASMKFYARVMSGDQMTRFIKELVPDIGDDQLNRVRTRIDERLGPYHPENVIGLMSNLAASRIANRLNLRGTSYTLDAACASSLIAVDHAVRELTSGRLDAVIAGGTHHNHDVSFWAVFTQIGALSRKQRIRPFHADADGLLLGEGTGMVVLKRLSDALRDGDRIYAVIRGVGVAGDGRSASLVSPETAGQVLAVRRAWEAAGLDPAAPDALGLLEAHGTATAVGDAAEVATMGAVFGPPQPGSAPVIGSVKSQIGHTLAAAGVAGLVKAALAVSRGVLLPTLHCDDPRPELESTRFRPIPSARPWESTGPRRAAVNAFGFGGINAHVILEQAPEPPRPRVTEPAAPVGAVMVTEPEQVLLLAGQDSVAITRLLDADDLAVRASGIPAASGTEAECRLGVVGPTAARLAAARKIVAAGNRWHGGRDIWFSPSPLLGAGRGKTAFVFPGLEADFTPQLADVIARFGIETRELDEQEYSGHLAAVIQVGWILHRALERIGVTPDAVAGHSLGEWTAGIVAGLADESTLDEQAKTLLNPVAIRDDLMHAVISESAENVTATLADYPEIFLSHDNAPSQAVVCGPASQVELLINEYGKRNVVCRGLPYATGVHTPYLEPFVRELREFDEGQAPLSARFPVWSGVTAAPLPADPEQRRELFFRQLTEPIQFRATMLAMHDHGVRVFLQAGPGQLASLIHDTLRDRDHLAMPVNVGSRSGLAQLRRVGTALWTVGGTPDLAALESGRNEKRDEKKDSKRRSLRMRLELGAEVITLGEGADTLMERERLALAADQPKPAGPGAVAALRAYADRIPEAGQLAAMLEETASAAVLVLSAGNSRSVLPVSLDAMPHLADHSFHRQPDGWPERADTMPVVPAAAIVAHMMDAVRGAVPGMVPIAVEDLSLRDWVLADPPREVELTVTLSGAASAGGPARYAVSFGRYARATVLVAAGYPAAPAVWEHEPRGEQPAAISAERMYGDRVVFHGPRYQGITQVHAQGERHIRTTIRALPAPGAVLDCGLQAMINWLFATQPERTFCLPVSIGAVRFFGPPPTDGDLLDCTLRVTELTGRQVGGDIQFGTAGGVRLQVEGAVGRRFDSHPRSRGAERDPGRVVTALRQPEGWVAQFSYWPDTATQHYIVRLMAGESGYREYQEQPVTRRKGWLLGRIAVKDAVRLAAWDADGGREIFPVEVSVTADDSGRAVAAGAVPECRAAFAQAGDVAVAITVPGVASGPHGLGIGVAVIADDPPSGAPRRTALSGVRRDPLAAAEEAVLAAVAGPGEDRSRWLARFHAARDAAAQASGTGPRSAAGSSAPGSTAPGEPRVVAADPAFITVECGGQPCRLRHREVSDPDLPEQRYAVAWT